MLRGRRPGVATRSAFALPEGDPVRTTNPLHMQSSSRSPPRPPLDNGSASWSHRSEGDRDRRLDVPPPSPDNITIRLAVAKPAHREDQELQGDASKKVVTCASPPPAPKELRFSPEDLDTKRVGTNQSPRRRQQEGERRRKGAAVVGTNRSLCKDFARILTRP